MIRYVDGHPLASLDQALYQLIIVLDGHHLAVIQWFIHLVSGSINQGDAYDVHCLFLLGLTLT